jgi:hypothetical protein
MMLTACSGGAAIPVHDQSINSEYQAGSTGRSSRAQSSESGICALLDANPAWINVLKRNEKKWGVKPSVFLAIIHQESKFDAYARPLDAKGRRLSSAYGYSQALDGTWKHYRQDTGLHKARRDSFWDSVDFIGWYIEKSHQHNRIKKHDVASIYLNYHEGWGGFANKTYRKKPWLHDVAQKVSRMERQYARELITCL